MRARNVAVGIGKAEEYQAVGQGNADQRGRSANIIGTDTISSNGVIHVIDRVILPRP